MGSNYKPQKKHQEELNFEILQFSHFTKLRSVPHDKYERIKVKTLTSNHTFCNKNLAGYFCTFV